MANRKILSYVLLGVLAVGVAAVVVSRSISVAETTVSDLTGETHFHGIAVDPRNPDRLYLATHHGFFAVGPAGVAERISETEDDFMGRSEEHTSELQSLMRNSYAVFCLKT